MKHLIGCCIFACASHSLMSQVTIQGNQPENDHLLEFIMDDENNTYVLGTYDQEIQLGDSLFTVFGTAEEGMFLAKYDPNGQVIWAMNGGSDREDLLFMDLTEDGDLVLAGSFYGQNKFGQIEMTTQSGESNDNFVLVLDANGNHMWHHHIQGPDHEHIQAVTTDESGNLYITGFYDAPFTWNSIAFPSTEKSDLFVLAFSKNGTPLWSYFAGGSNNDWPWDITLKNDQVLIVGKSSGNFRNNDFSEQGFGNSDAFILQLNKANGSYVHHRVFGNEYSQEFRHILSDESGIYANGLYSQTLQIGNASLESEGYNDGFVVKMDELFNPNWAISMGGASSDEYLSNLVLHDGNITMTGSFNRDQEFGEFTSENQGSRDILVYSIHPESGIPAGLSSLSSTGLDRGKYVRSHNQQLYVGGYFSGSTLMTNGGLLTNLDPGKADFFVTRAAFPLAVSDQPQDKTAKWYPIPSKGKIQTPSPWTNVELRNIHGKTLIKVAGPLSELDLSPYQTGIYFLRGTSSKGETENQTIVKE